MLLALLAVLSFLIIRPFLLAIFIGALLAYVCNKPYQKLLKKLNNETATALLVCIVVIFVVLIVGIFFVQTLVQESYVLFVSVKQKLAVGLFKGCENGFCNWVEGFARNPEIAYQIQEASRTVTNWIIKKGSNFLVAVPQMILNLFVAFFTMFYFLKDGARITGNLDRFFSAQQKRYSHVTRRLKEIVHGVVYGYLLVALIQGALGALGFFIFGVSSPLFWGLVMAFLALIPFIGTGFVWVPASILIFLDGVFHDSNWVMFKGIALFVYCLLFVASLDNLLRPKLVGEKAKVHPAIVMVGIFGGILLFGPLGVIIGPLVLSLTTVIIKTYLQK